ncbi:MAG TPA: gephyrin-like molybdotransferase Glp, partial [Patescibacteria group bacterium]|nr:gephyrin-like molybdotransferase Glp [Patescibacteria group bacterium]
MSETLLSVEEARAAVLAAIDAPLPVETHAPETALGLVLALAVTAATDLPPWDNSAMDGFAIRAADVSAATEDAPVTLRVVGDVPAGGVATVRVEAGTAIRIATGAPLPAGADAVVAVEQTTPLSADGSAAGPRGRDATGPVPAACAVHEAVSPGSAVRRRGEDLRAGDTVLEAGTVMTPAAIAIAAGSGVDAVAVHRRPRIAVLATGDEVRAPGEPLGDAGIPDANGPGLRAMVEAAGGVAVDLGIARDDLDDVLTRLQRGLAEADAVIVAGGVSVGPYDVVKNAFEALGSVVLWRVAVQPGKPFAFGRTTDGGVLFGLPGNPVSGFVTFELFVRPAIRRLAGHRRLLRDTDVGTLDQAVTKAPRRRAFLRVLAERDRDDRPVRDATGRVRLRLAGGQG